MDIIGTIVTETLEKRLEISKNKILNSISNSQPKLGKEYSS